MTEIKDYKEVILSLLEVLSSSTTAWDLESLADSFIKYNVEINTPLRLAHFWSQMAHETGGFRWDEELGSETYFQKYDGRADLGNVIPGDGYRYRGRGLIQITGRYNYARMGKETGFPLEELPDLAASPDVAMLIAISYWNDKGLNDYADDDNTVMITKRINGGMNGYGDRLRLLNKAKTQLGLQ